MNYLGTNAKNEEGLKRVDAMVEGISFEFIQDPEAFNPKAAMANILSEGRLADLQRNVDDAKAKVDIGTPIFVVQIQK